MERLLGVLNRVCPEVDFMNSRNLVDEGILDSFDIVTIISEIEEEYGINIAPNDIDPDNFQSVSTIYEMIENIIEEKV